MHDEIIYQNYGKNCMNTNSRVRRMFDLRHDLPYVPVLAVPDWMVTFQMASGQSENLILPADLQLFLIMASNSAALLTTFGGGKPVDPPTLVTADSLSGGDNPNLDSLSNSMLNATNILFDSYGVSGLGLKSFGATNIVSVVGWKNAGTSGDNFKPDVSKINLNQDSFNF